MALSPEWKSNLSRLGGAGVARLIGFVSRTSSHAFDPPDLKERLRRQHPAICACWHGQFMMLASGRPHGLEVAAMVARHGDAELIGEAMARLGVKLIRGAGAGGRKKDRGGAHALRASVSALKDNYSLVITADVPPGPARRAGEGIITLARLSGRPIIPSAAATSRYHALNTWSRMTINLPYSRLAFAIGEPIEVPRDASPELQEALRQHLEDALNDATRRAYELAGADPARATPPGARPVDAPPLKAGSGLRLYRAGMRTLQTVAPIVLGHRTRQGKEIASRRSERYGQARIARPEGALMWIHAASVGETNAILPVIRSLKSARPDLGFLLTTGTVTSANLVEERLGDSVIHQFLPLDTTRFARSFLDHWRPDVAAFTESEIWPNLIWETHERQIPLVLINGRMSKRSYLRWRKRPGIAGPLFNRIDLVLVQNELFGRWFRELGARRVEVAGNLKIDAPPLPIDMRAYEELVGAARGRRGYVAASTHPGEDEMIADAHRRIATVYPGILTIIAPRHPERGTAIAEMVKNKGLRVAQRSLRQLPTPTTDIYIADTIGEMGTLYALAPLALIGGSLVEKGGQNPVEAIRHETAVISGPHVSNFRDIYNTLRRAGALREVSSAEDIAQAVTMLLANEPELEALRDKGQQALGELSGALDLTVSRLLERVPYVPQRSGSGRELDRAS